MNNKNIKVSNNDLEMLIALAKEVAKPSENAVCFCKWIIKALLIMLAGSIGLNAYLMINNESEVNLIADNNKESNVEQYKG